MLQIHSQHFTTSAPRAIPSASHIFHHFTAKFTSQPRKFTTFPSKSKIRCNAPHMHSPLTASPPPITSIHRTPRTMQHRVFSPVAAIHHKLTIFQPKMTAFLNSPHMFTTRPHKITALTNPFKVPSPSPQVYHKFTAHRRTPPHTHSKSPHLHNRSPHRQPKFTICCRTLTIWQRIITTASRKVTTSSSHFTATLTRTRIRIKYTTFRHKVTAGHLKRS